MQRTLFLSFAGALKAIDKGIADAFVLIDGLFYLDRSEAAVLDPWKHGYAYEMMQLFPDRHIARAAHAELVEALRFAQTRRSVEYPHNGVSRTYTDLNYLLRRNGLKGIELGKLPNFIGFDRELAKTRALETNLDKLRIIDDRVEVRAS